MVNAIDGEGFVSSLRFLLISAFFMQMLTGVVGLTVPIYAASTGASPLLIGVIGATGGLVYSFMPLASGVLSDRIRRKILILVAMLVYGVSCTLYILVENPSMLIPIKAMEWISVAIFWPSNEALLAELSKNKLKQNLRKFNLSWGSATIIGPTIGGLLISLSGLKAPFLLSSAVSLGLTFLATVTIKELPRNKPNVRHEENHKLKKGENSIFTAIVAIILFSFISGVIYNLFPAHAISLGIPAYEIGLIMFTNGLFRLAAFIEAYKIEAKMGKRTFLAGSLMLALASALTAFSSTTIMFALTFSIFGFGMGILYAASIALILRSRSSAKGYAAGLFESLIGVGNFLGSSTGGLASEYVAMNAPYVLVLLASAAAAIYLSIQLVKRGSKNLPEGV